MSYSWHLVLSKRDSGTEKWDPVSHLLEAGIQPAPYQEEVLSALARERRVAAWGPHGLGKTAMAAWAVLSFARHWDGKEDWKALTTASIWRQLTEYLWPEIRKWEPLILRGKRGVITTKLKIDGLTGSAFPVASDNPETIEGAHAEHLLYILDEAKLIQDGVWTAALSAMTTSDCYILALSTPGLAGSYFHRLATGRIKGWWLRHVGLDEALKAGRVTREWVAQLAEEWGEHSAEFKRRVLGHWVEEEDHNALFPSSALLRATELEPSGPVVCIGVDVARGGGDLSAIAVRTAGGIKEVKTFDTNDLMTLSGIVVRTVKELEVPAVIDTTGIGAGLYDRLRELDVEVYPFVAASKPSSEDGIRRWANLRAQGYFIFSKAVQEGRCALPRDEDLLEELQWIRGEPASDGSLRIVAKDKLPRSPDRADAAMMAWAYELVREPAFDVF